jgi:hypothetical protein
VARVAFFLDDLFSGHMLAHSTQDDAMPALNVEDDRPGIAFQAAEGDGGQFEISTGNCWLDVNEGGGEVSVSIPWGAYRRQDLAIAIETALNVAAGLALTYACAWNSNQQCRIWAAGGNFSLLWLTGTHAATSAGTELGFSVAADDAGSSFYIADEVRYSTSTWLLWDLGAANNLYAAAVILDGDDDTEYGTGGGSLRCYGNATNLGAWVEVWKSSAALSLAFSSRPSEDENKIQVCGQATPAAAYRYYMIGWRHFDESAEHRVGIARGWGRPKQSTTRTVRAIQGHELVDPAEALRQGDYYPTGGEKVWRLPLAFDAWLDTDYRAVVHPVLRHGRNHALLVALRWDDILAATYDADDEADKGLLLWGCLVDYGGDSLAHEGSSWMSGELVVEQVR